MNKKLILIGMGMMLILSGCGKKQSDTEDNQTKEEITLSESIFDENGFCNRQIEFGIGYDDENLENEDNTISRKLHLDGMEDAEFEVGVLVFEDGILQPVSVDGMEAKTFNICKVEEQSEYDISFELVSGNAGDKVRIDTISLLNPNMKITENTKDLGLSFETSNPYPYFVQCKTTVENPVGAEAYSFVELSDNVREMYIYTDDDGSEVNMLKNSMNIAYLQGGDTASILKVEEGKLSFDMDICGGEGAEYNLYVFLDNEAVKFIDGKEYDTVEITYDKATRVSAVIDVSDMNIDEYTQLFVVAVPTGDNKSADASVRKLSNIVVDNTEEFK